MLCKYVSDNTKYSITEPGGIITTILIIITIIIISYYDYNDDGDYIS